MSISPQFPDLSHTFTGLSTDLASSYTINLLPIALAGTFLAGMAFDRMIQKFQAPKEVAEPKKEWTVADYLPKVNVVFHTHRPLFSDPFHDPFFDLGLGLHTRHFGLFL